MVKMMFLLMGIAMVSMFAQTAKAQYESDILHTSAGDLKITFVGHGTLMFEFNQRIIHVDPYSQVADYAQLPKADLILITHDHPDHLDLKAVAFIRQPHTVIAMSASCAAKFPEGIVLKNGDERTVAGLSIKAVPAYNLVHKRPDGLPFHPKGVGNGYVILFGDKRVYVAGDTENIAEMKALQHIDCAFLPMNLPYTMTPQMVADAAIAFKPGILYPYHYGDTETADLVALLANERRIDVRIRKMR